MLAMEWKTSPFTSMNRTPAGDVRYRCKSGTHLLLVSSSHSDPKQTIGPGLDSAPDAPCVHGSGFFNDSVDGLTTRGPPKKKSGPRPAPAMDSGRNDPARGTRAEADTTAGP
jgi:hypothetical protein